jgi:hypothetical protein
MTELTYLVIPADPEASTSIKQCLFSEAYSVMRDTVGGYIELVRLQMADMYINENGKEQNLRVNARATQLAWVDRAMGVDDFIVGNAILFGRADERGDETSITPEFRSHMLRMLGGRA